MVKFFDKTLSRLNSSPLETVPATLEFEHFDAGKLATRLSIEKQGTDRGTDNQPEAKSNSFDSVETTIIAEIENYRKKAVDRMTVAIEAYAAREHSFDFNHIRSEIVASISAAKTNLEATVSQGKMAFFSKKQALVDSDADLKRFKTDHNLLRQAHMPDSGDKMIIFGIVGVMFLIESIMNGVFFSGSLEGGLLEGVGVAIAIAALNVFVGFAAGLLVARFLIYRNYIAKAFAFFGILLDLLFATYLNIGVAKFRQSLENLDALSAVQETFFVSPLNLIDHLGDLSGFMPFLLVGIGLLFHVAAIIDGFKLDDPYPFYGKYWRKRSDSQDDYYETAEILIEELTEVRDETIEEMQASSKSLSASRQVYSRLREFKNQNNERYTAYLDWLETTANQLLKLYREANVRTRSDKAPSYFNEEWKISRTDFTPTDDAGNENSDELIKKTNEDLEIGIHDVNEKYDETVKQYRQIEVTLEEAGSNGSA